ncbi:hypothetical protein As57867_005752, partial [Aphanomyces stellatus]
AHDEIRKMNIMLQENCLPGSVEDFTPAFKAMWHINGTSPSFALLQAIQSGADPIRIENWQDILAKFFDGCRGDTKQDKFDYHVDFDKLDDEKTFVVMKIGPHGCTS